MFKVCFCFFFYQLVSFHLLLFQRNPTELDDAFAKIAEFMAQTTSHCKVSDYVPKHLYVDFSYRPGRIKYGFCLCCRDFTSLVVARSPVTLKRTTCPGFTHSQHLQRHQLRYQPGNATNTK